MTYLSLERSSLFLGSCQRLLALFLCCRQIRGGLSLERLLVVVGSHM